MSQYWSARCNLSPSTLPTHWCYCTLMHFKQAILVFDSYPKAAFLMEWETNPRGIWKISPHVMSLKLHNWKTRIAMNLTGRLAVSQPNLPHRVILRIKKGRKNYTSCLEGVGGNRNAIERQMDCCAFYKFLGYGRHQSWVMEKMSGRNKRFLDSWGWGELEDQRSWAGMYHSKIRNQ